MGGSVVSINPTETKKVETVFKTSKPFFSMPAGLEASDESNQPGFGPLALVTTFRKYIFGSKTEIPRDCFLDRTFTIDYSKELGPFGPTFIHVFQILKDSMFNTADGHDVCASAEQYIINVILFKLLDLSVMPITEEQIPEEGHKLARFINKIMADLDEDDLTPKFKVMLESVRRKILSTNSAIANYQKQNARDMVSATTQIKIQTEAVHVLLCEALRAGFANPIETPVEYFVNLFARPQEISLETNPIAYFVRQLDDHISQEVALRIKNIANSMEPQVLELQSQMPTTFDDSNGVNATTSSTSLAKRQLSGDALVQAATSITSRGNNSFDHGGAKSNNVMDKTESLAGLEDLFEQIAHQIEVKKGKDPKKDTQSAADKATTIKALRDFSKHSIEIQILVKVYLEKGVIPLSRLGGFLGMSHERISPVINLFVNRLKAAYGHLAKDIELLVEITEKRNHVKTKNDAYLVELKENLDTLIGKIESNCEHIKLHTQKDKRAEQMAQGIEALCFLLDFAHQNQAQQVVTETVIMAQGVLEEHKRAIELTENNTRLQVAIDDLEKKVSSLTKKNTDLEQNNQKLKSSNLALAKAKASAEVDRETAFDDRDRSEQRVKATTADLLSVKDQLEARAGEAKALSAINSELTEKLARYDALDRQAEDRDAAHLKVVTALTTSVEKKLNPVVEARANLLQLTNQSAWHSQQAGKQGVSKDKAKEHRETAAAIKKQRDSLQPEVTKQTTEALIKASEQAAAAVSSDIAIMQEHYDRKLSDKNAEIAKLKEELIKEKGKNELLTAERNSARTERDQWKQKFEEFKTHANSVIDNLKAMVDQLVNAISKFAAFDLSKTSVKSFVDTATNNASQSVNAFNGGTASPPAYETVEEITKIEQELAEQGTDQVLKRYEDLKNHSLALARAVSQWHEERTHWYSIDHNSNHNGERFARHFESYVNMQWGEFISQTKQVQPAAETAENSAQPNDRQTIVNQYDQHFATFSQNVVAFMHNYITFLVTAKTEFKESYGSSPDNSQSLAPALYTAAEIMSEELGVKTNSAPQPDSNSLFSHTTQFLPTFTSKHAPKVHGKDSIVSADKENASKVAQLVSDKRASLKGFVEGDLTKAASCNGDDKVVADARKRLTA